MRRSSSSNITRSSSRASHAPRQKCVPKPNATWRLSGRVTSRRSGSVNARGSRLAAAYISTTWSPSRSVCPCSSCSSVTVRRMLRIGVTHRMNSSTAVVESSSGCSTSSRRWSGCSASSRIIEPMTVRVVSAPPSRSSSVSSSTCIGLPPLGDPDRDQVVARLGPTGFDQLRGLGEEVDHHRHDVGVRHVRRAVGHVQAAQRHGLLRPVPQQLPHVARVAEQVADHHRRQPRRDRLDHLALTERHDGVEDVGHERAHVVLLPAHAARVEAPRHQLALLLVRRDRPC